MVEIRLADRRITIRCTRSRGPRGSFCLHDVRRGPVNVAVMPPRNMKARFSLKSLALLVASWPIAFVLSSFLASPARRDVSTTVDSITAAQPAVELAGKAVNHINRAPALDRKTMLLSMLWSGAEFDAWGRPLQVMDPRKPTSDATKSKFGVYSTGVDGRSESFGNDPDDINSWDNHHDAYYQRRSLKGGLLHTAWLTPVTALVIITVSRMFKRTPNQSA